MIKNILSFMNCKDNDRLTIIAITFLFYSITYTGSLAVFNIIDFYAIPVFIIFICLLEVSFIKFIFSKHFLNGFFDKYIILKKLSLATTLLINIFLVNLGFIDFFPTFHQRDFGNVIFDFFIFWNFLYYAPLKIFCFFCFNIFITYYCG